MYEIPSSTLPLHLDSRLQCVQQRRPPTTATSGEEHEPPVCFSPLVTIIPLVEAWNMVALTTQNHRRSRVALLCHSYTGTSAQSGVSGYRCCLLSPVSALTSCCHYFTITHTFWHSKCTGTSIHTSQFPNEHICYCSYINYQQNTRYFICCPKILAPAIKWLLTSVVQLWSNCKVVKNDSKQSTFPNSNYYYFKKVWENVWNYFLRSEKD